MAQIVTRLESKPLAVSGREKLVLIEIGEDIINSASSFVDYMSEEYGISKSSVWYNLNCLKEKGLIRFADRQHAGVPLKLTQLGSQILCSLGEEKREILGRFAGRTEVGYAAAAGFGRVGGLAVYPAR